MQSNQLLAGISRTRPATYKASVDADGRVVLRHWIDPITIVVERPASAPFVTFTKFVGKDAAIKVTTPAGEFRNRLTIPDATLCWATLERFDRAPVGRDADHLIVRDGKILRQPKRGGSDARVGGSDARELAHTRVRAHARARAGARVHARALENVPPAPRSIFARSVFARSVFALSIFARSVFALSIGSRRRDARRARADTGDAGPP